MNCVLHASSPSACTNLAHCCPSQVPYRLLKAFHKIQPRLVRELEKKFSGKDVVFVANRRILPPPRNGKASARPRSRTLTAVGAFWVLHQIILPIAFPRATRLLV
jgi:hypothetical protein